MAWISNSNTQFRLKFSEDIFNQKYRHEGAETWSELANTLVEDVCREYMSREDKDQLTQYISDLKFLAGGRYNYYAGRPHKFFNNCFLFRAEEDSREDWARISWSSEMALMTGGGIGVDYSVYRPSGAPIRRTGGTASGPIPKAAMVNEIGRNVMQGGSRRSAIYASLDSTHDDAEAWIYAKDWRKMPVGNTGYSVFDVKQQDFNYPAPFDMTNMSLNFKTAWLEHYKKTGEVGEIFLKSVDQALRTGEPGFSFNFYEKENETLRNACTEVVSEDNADCCNLGSVNMSRIETLEEFANITRLGTMFLLCGTLVAELPFEAIARTREKNRRLGLGLLGMHEFLIKRGSKYEVTPELHQWLGVWRDVSDKVSKEFADALGVSRPIANRAIAPTGSLAILAGTTSGIEPLYSVAYKRRFLRGNKWHYQYVVDGTAQLLINEYGVDPNSIESAIDLAQDYERRIKFQADVQDYVDMAISSTLNLPAWGTEYNNEDKIKPFAETLAKYAHRLRGATFYPDGARGGQPLTSVPYEEAVKNLGTTFEENLTMHDACEIGGKGSCGL